MRTVNKQEVTMGFTKWIKDCIDGMRVDINSVVPRLMSECIQQIEGAPEVIHRFAKVNSGAVYASDLDFIGARILSETFVFATCTKVVIKGITFKCRGLPPQQEVADWDDLTLYWDDHRHSATWCQLTAYAVVEEEVKNMEDQPKKRSKVSSQQKPKYVKRKRVASPVVHGQLDFAFRINMPEDKLVHGVAFGHFTTRATDFDDNRRHFRVNVGYALSPAPQPRFISLNYVNSTAVALSGLAQNGLPLLKSDYLTSFTKAYTDKNKGIYAPSKTSLYFLYFIELHPERVTFEYQSIWWDDPDDVMHRQIDADGTKVLEQQRPKLTTRGTFKQCDQFNRPTCFEFV